MLGAAAVPMSARQSIARARTAPAPCGPRLARSVGWHPPPLADRHASESVEEVQRMGNAPLSPATCASPTTLRSASTPAGPRIAVRP